MKREIAITGTGDIPREEKFKIIQMMLKEMLLMPFFLLPFFPLSAQERTDSVYEFRFVSVKDMFFIPYADNLIRLERLSAVVRQHHEAIADGKIPVFVDGYCNSLPGEAANLSVARLRSNRVKTELILHAGLTEDCFVTRNHAEKGDYVTVKIRVPAVLTSATDTICHVGRSRNISSPKSQEEEILRQAQNDEEARVSSDLHRVPSDLQSDVSKYQDFQSPFSLRTNLLRWATFTPDLGIEWRISRHVAILVGGSWTSWSWSDKARRYTLWKLSPEVRYYIGKEQRGYLGAMFHTGDFNYKFGSTGKQGDYQGGGITGGYLLPLNRRLSLDFHAGIGYTRAGYDKYRVTDGICVRGESETKNYWGINQFGVTLVWMIN